MGKADISPNKNYFIQNLYFYRSKDCPSPGNEWIVGESKEAAPPIF
jgi:hypothetical protein